MGALMIGVDPHKASNTIVVIDGRERVLARRRFANDRDGYRALRAAAKAHPDRTWAVEGARGVKLSLTKRLVAEGEPVLDAPAKFSARAGRLVVEAAVRPTTRRLWLSRSLGYAPAG